MPPPLLCGTLAGTRFSKPNQKAREWGKPTRMFPRPAKLPCVNCLQQPLALPQENALQWPSPACCPRAWSHKSISAFARTKGSFCKMAPKRSPSARPLSPEQKLFGNRHWIPPPPHRRLWCDADSPGELTAPPCISSFSPAERFRT